MEQNKELLASYGIARIEISNSGEDKSKKDKTKEVTKEEFNNFIASYPNPLKYDVAMMYDPAIGSYNDFTDDQVWPDSIVGFIKIERDNSRTYFLYED